MYMKQESIRVDPLYLNKVSIIVFYHYIMFIRVQHNYSKQRISMKVFIIIYAIHHQRNNFLH